MRLRIVSVIALIFSAFFFSSCGGAGDTPEVQEQVNVKSVVTLYTTILAEGYARLNMSSLLQVATEKRATKAYHYMASLGEARSKMLPNLEQISFSRVVLSSQGKAEAYTDEEWRYAFVSIDSGKEMFANRIHYKLTYHLLKEENRWLVDDITIREAVEEENSQERVPYLQRPEAKAGPGIIQNEGGGDKGISTGPPVVE